MNYAEIKTCDIANGEGVRTSLFVSGCTHRCKGCFNEIAWDFEYGKIFDEQVEEYILKELKPAYIAGLTLLGGEPFEPCNQRGLLPFLEKMKEQFPNKNIWCYTGYLYDKDLCQGGRAYCECTDRMLELIDILVDGPFVEAQKDIRLKFRGSSNQRIIDLRKTEEEGKICLHEIR